MKDVCIEAAKEVEEEYGVTLQYSIGTMLEPPRAVQLPIRLLERPNFSRLVPTT